MTHTDASAASKATPKNATIRRVRTGRSSRLTGYTGPNRYPKPRTVWM
jgi:hypothetical protein